MKKTAKQALQEMDQKALDQKVSEISREFSKAKIEAAAGKLADTAKVYRLRKELAVVKTIIKQKRSK